MDEWSDITPPLIYYMSYSISGCFSKTMVAKMPHKNEDSRPPLKKNIFWRLPLDIKFQVLAIGSVNG